MIESSTFSKLVTSLVCSDLWQQTETWIILVSGHAFYPIAICWQGDKRKQTNKKEI